MIPVIHLFSPVSKHLFSISRPWGLVIFALPQSAGNYRFLESTLLRLLDRECLQDKDAAYGVIGRVQIDSFVA
jgi:hypothetical protein